MKYRKKMSDIFQMSTQVFIICIVIIILSLAAMCFKFLDANREDAISKSQRAVAHVNYSVDLILKNADEDAFQLGINYMVVNYMDYYRALDYPTLLKTDEFFTSFFSVNPYIHDISIYYIDEDMVYSPKSGVFKLSEFHDKGYIESIKDDRIEMRTVKKRIANKIVGEEAYEVITIAKTVPLISNTPKAIIVVNILSDYFDNSISELNIDEEMNILLINDKNEPMINFLKDDRVDYTELLSEIDSRSIFDDHYFTNKSDDEENIVSYSVSSYSNWKCIGIIPYNTIYKGLYSLWLFVIILIIVLLVASVLMSIMLAINMYKPLAALASFFTSISRKRENNIHDYIKSNISYVLEKNKLLEDSLNEFQPVIKNNFITNLLTGAAYDHEQVLRQIENFDLDLGKHSDYVVYMISYRNNEKYNDYSHKQKVMMEIYILETLNAFISSNWSGIACESGMNEITVILNHAGSGLDECCKYGKEIHAFLLKNMRYAVHVTIGMGNCVDDIMNIPDSRLEAMQALSFSFMAGYNKFICFENMKKLNKNYYNYPYRKEQELITHLKRCDIDKARDVLNEIIIPISSADAHNLYYVSIQLLCAVVRLMNELGEKSHTDSEEFNAYKVAENISTVEDIRTFFDRMFNKVIAFIIDKRDNKNQFSIEKVINYIDENFRLDISLEMLAEQVFFSTTYLSKLFKQETGMNIKEYIDKVRITKAKELLKNSKYSIQQVGDLTGYVQSQSFIKFFKRHMGVTPGEYRHMLNNNGEEEIK